MASNLPTTPSLAIRMSGPECVVFCQFLKPLYKTITSKLYTRKMSGISAALERERKIFDDTKAGVKGLIERGITEVPRIFINPRIDSDKTTQSASLELKFPLIDLENIDEDPVRRNKVVDEVRKAAGTWGFFQVINHQIPVLVMEQMLDGVRKFYELDPEERKKWYTRDDRRRRVLYNSNFDLFISPTANWRDTVYCQMAPDSPKPEELPEVCRDIMIEYTKKVLKLGSTLFQLLSESLGLKSSYLEEVKCLDGLAMLCHYYPECPQPELTLGTSSHTDPDFLTVLLTDQVNGLQVFYQNQWVDVPPLPGTLVVNIGDLLQLVSNDKFSSASHRVLTNNIRSRVSVACFLRGDPVKTTDVYSPIHELFSENDPPKYRATTIKEYISYFNTKGLDETAALPHFRI